jgi:hypothetical protein
MNRTALRPSTAPLGATRNTLRPGPSPAISPTAPFSQNSMPLSVASIAAGSLIVLP